MVDLWELSPLLGSTDFGVSAVQARISANHFQVRHDLILNTKTRKYLDALKISMDQIDIYSIHYSTVRSTPASPIFHLPFQDPAYLFVFGANLHRQIPKTSSHNNDHRHHLHSRHEQSCPIVTPYEILTKRTTTMLNMPTIPKVRKIYHDQTPWATSPEVPNTQLPGTQVYPDLRYSAISLHPIVAIVFLLLLSPLSPPSFCLNPPHFLYGHHALRRQDSGSYLVHTLTKENEHPNPIDNLLWII